MRDTKTQDFFPKFGHSQRMFTSPLWSSQRAESLSTLIQSEQSPKSSLVFTIKSAQRRGQYKLSDANHNLVRLGEQISKSNEYTEIVGEVFEMKIEWVTQE
jgi:hypothetical protein